MNAHAQQAVRLSCSACRLKVKHQHLHKSPSIPPIYPNKINRPKMYHELKGVRMCHIVTNRYTLIHQSFPLWQHLWSVLEELWFLLRDETGEPMAAPGTPTLRCYCRRYNRWPQQGKSFWAAVFTGLIFGLSINLLILWFPNCGPWVLQVGHQNPFQNSMFFVELKKEIVNTL